MSTPCVKIKWTDPPDILTNEPAPATWAGTVVVRKENSAPRHRWDGTLIVDSTTRDEYASTAYVDNTVELDKDYYYGVFPYDTNGYVRYTKVKHIDTHVDKTVEFDFTGEIQTFVVPKTGIYQLEVWGAQGGNADMARGGYGAYAIGEVLLNQGDILYISVGGQNGWNGGGIDKDE